eukprot:TRINITY_DN48950_c0_g1_i1.p1 TRINITY_DN48950_c0_g1~~TRINITY_DN48950_c0_g1_i1.p1  ORF type:complete len:278 (+),score=39.22 TRINITY_DN48950_c0_g1_i1:145-978(+)
MKVGRPHFCLGVRFGRELLRESRSLGPRWTPVAPASDVLWGQGLNADPRALHPLLARIAPASIHEGLYRSLVSQKCFTSWLREKLRRDRSVAKSDDITKFLKHQRILKDFAFTSEEGGLRLDAVSGFVPRLSNEPVGQFVFTYNMRFTNVGKVPLRVLGRQYDFCDNSGALSSQIKLEETDSAGVVGYTPLIKPGDAFEFGSGVPLRSSTGTLVGSFLVMEEPEVPSEDISMHKQMEKEELMLRFVYFKGMDTNQFRLPVNLRFDQKVHCVVMTDSK